MTPERYQALLRWLEARPALKKLVIALNRWLPAVPFACYPLLLVLLNVRWFRLLSANRAAALDFMQLIARAVFVPAFVFLGGTLLRARLNFPRPYEQPGFTPLVPKETHGKSFPSRHALSAAVLAAQQTGNWVAMQGLELLAMLVAAAMGAVFSLLLSFASINLRADQTIGGTALNLMAPALVLFLVRIIANQNTLQLATGDSATWFMIRKSTFGIDKNTDLGFFGETFLVKVYLATYVCIILFVILSIILYKTRFGLRLRACGENPQAADSLGINVYKMRYIGTTISGALAGMGGFVYALTTANCSSNGDVAGFGFLALAVMIFGNWRPLNIAGASLLFGLFKCIAAAYSSIDINGDGVYWLAEIGISSHLYRMLPYIITLLVLAFTSKKSRAPKAEGIPYDKARR